MSKNIKTSSGTMVRRENPEISHIPRNTPYVYTLYMLYALYRIKIKIIFGKTACTTVPANLSFILALKLHNKASLHKTLVKIRIRSSFPNMYQHHLNTIYSRTIFHTGPSYPIFERKYLVTQ